MASWADLTRSTTAIQIARQAHSNLVILRSDTSVREALKTLATNNILSAPVVGDDTCLGFVDVLDITGYVLHTWRRYNLSATWGNNASKTIDDFFSTPIQEVINFSNIDYPVYVTEGNTLKDVLDAMSGHRRNFKPHRVAILNTNNNVTNIITQSDVVAFAAKYLESVSKTVWGSKTLKELGIPHTPIEVRIDTYFSDALRILYDNHVSGIALVDDQSRLSANLSASDLRGITPESFDYFTGSTLQFLVKGSTISRPHSPIVCTPETTMSEAINLLAKNKIHRLYIVDVNDRPVGVISLSDIVQVLRNV